MKELQNSGRHWFRKCAPDEELDALEQYLDADDSAGTRLTAHTLAELLPETLDNVRSVVPDSKPVRSVMFRKTDDVNWGVPWHQDRIIAVAARHDVDGFGNWSQKQGIWHCEPPVVLLEKMFFLRIHLDDQTEANGAMQLALGSHRLGRIPASEADQVASSSKIETGEAQRGDVLLLNMLVLHSSKPATVSSRRRVLRVDLAAFDLPPPLNWN